MARSKKSTNKKTAARGRKAVEHDN